MYAKDRTTVIDRREMLRVKIKSLAAEARIIRREERRTHGALRDALLWHRTGAVRVEARATHLAYGFIRGLTRDQMEPKRAPIVLLTVPEVWEQNLMAKVDAMVQKYGPARAPLKIAA